jgi:hypothetical protein
MALTKILDRSELKKELKLTFPRPKIQLSKTFICTEISQKIDTRLIGIAYDYILRFQATTINSHLIAREKLFVATKGLSNLIYEYQDPKQRLIRLGHQKNIKFVEKEQVFAYLTAGFPIACQEYFNVLSSRTFNIGTANAAIFFAKLEVYYRTKKLGNNIFDNCNAEAEAILNLINSNKIKFLKAKSLCVLNPTFGIGSLGADADIIIDGTLIEFKTTARRIIERKTLDQLISYYFLSIIKRSLSESSHDKLYITHLAVFLSRHNTYWKIPIYDLIPPDKIVSYGNWFVNYIGKYFTKFTSTMQSMIEIEFKKEKQRIERFKMLVDLKTPKYKIDKILANASID